MMLNIASEPTATPITKPRRAKKVKLMSGALARDSPLSRRKTAVAATANQPIGGSGAARACGNACRANTSDTIKVVRNTNPSQSARRLSPREARAEPAEARPAIAASMSTTLNQKITRQPAKCVRAPPSSGPTLKPSMRKPVHAPIAPALRCDAALVSTAASMLGNAAMIAVLLEPTASIARHDDHRTEAKPLHWFNVAASSGQARADDTPHGPPALVLTVAVGCYPECAVQSY